MIDYLHKIFAYNGYNHTSLYKFKQRLIKKLGYPSAKEFDDTTGIHDKSAGIMKNYCAVSEMSQKKFCLNCKYLVFSILIFVLSQ